MTKVLDIHRLSWHKDSNTLTAFESDVRDFGFQMLAGSYDTFEVQGQRETRRYISAGVEREKARNEIGDILYWIFRPVDGHGHYQPGPAIHIFND